MRTPTRTTSALRKAYLRQIVQHNSLKDIYSGERKTQWDAFSHSEKKRIQESMAFVGFVKASGLTIDPFDHENEDPPLPDIQTTTAGETYYFELGEILDQGLARATGDSLKTGESTCCAFSQIDPLLRMFRLKCATRYQTNGTPVDLLLFYSTQNPYEPLLYESLKVHEAEINALIAGSPFTRIWLYSDCRPQKVLWKGTR